MTTPIEDIKHKRDNSKNTRSLEEIETWEMYVKRINNLRSNNEKNH